MRYKVKYLVGAGVSEPTTPEEQKKSPAGESRGTARVPAPHHPTPAHTKIRRNFASSIDVDVTMVRSKNN